MKNEKVMWWEIFGIAILLYAPISIIMLRFTISTLVLDILITANLLFAIAILIAVLCAGKRLNLFLLPILFLVSTLFNMAMAIGAVNLILTKGAEFDGRLIRFVSSLLTGSGETDRLITGSANFLIIIAVIFYVITELNRGVEGSDYYMSIKLQDIEVEYTSGEISEEEAVSRKAVLQKKSDFLNALENYVKFLSGDVKLILLVIGCIFVGGLLTIFENDNSANDAILTYFPLAIGSGIIFMLHSFLISLAARCIFKKEIKG